MSATFTLADILAQVTAQLWYVRTGDAIDWTVPGPDGVPVYPTAAPAIQVPLRIGRQRYTTEQKETPSLVWVPRREPIVFPGALHGKGANPQQWAMRASAVEAQLIGREFADTEALYNRLYNACRALTSATWQPGEAQWGDDHVDQYGYLLVWPMTFMIPVTRLPVPTATIRRAPIGVQSLPEGS